MKVVLTGATGFIGSAVAAELLARGHAVFALTRPESDLSRLKRFGGWNGISCDSWRDSVVKKNLLTVSPDTFVHCAWQGVVGAERNAAWQITTNLRITSDALELAKAVGCSHWVSLGSQAEYGNLNHRISEACPLRPTTVYGKAKLIAGQAALAYCDAEGMKATIMRVFSTYGPGDAPSWFIPYIIREFSAQRAPKLTACEQLWDYLYVTDAARAIVSVVETRAVDVFNLGSGRAVQLRAVVELIKKEMNVTEEPDFGAVQYRPDQVMCLEADITRLTQATGWTPTVSLESGIRNTVKFTTKTNTDQS